MILSVVQTDKMRWRQKAVDDKNGKKWAFLCISLILGVFFSAFFVGFIPSELGFLLVGAKGSAFLRNFVILLFKLFFFFVILSLLRGFSCVRETLRFNCALQGVLSPNTGKNAKKSGFLQKFLNDSGDYSINFLNFIIFTFVLDIVVITLSGVAFGPWLNMLFYALIFLLSISFSYEILRIVSLSNIAWLKNLFSLAVFAKASTTHKENVSIALTELGLLCSQKERELMEEEDYAFSVVYNEVKNKLAAAGINDKSDVDWLIATILGKNRAEIKLVSKISEKDYQEIIRAAQRRAKGESLDNIFGFTEFFGMRFDVSKKVLTPRMETEILVEEVLKTQQNYKNPTILDLGTGSGAIAISLAKNCNAFVTAVDISKSALAQAAANAKKNDVKVEFLHSNLFDGLKRKKKFDIIVSNPPYIPSQEIEKLEKHVRECDPLLALDGGEDGLDFYREIIEKAPERLNAGGMLFFEVGKGQSASVRKLLRARGFKEIRTIKDYNKIERIVCGKYC